MAEKIVNYTGDTTQRELWEDGPTVKKGTSRNLDPTERAFTVVMFQQGKPPLDSEMNLMQQIQNHQRAELVRALLSSGILRVNVQTGVAEPLNSVRITGAAACVNGYLLKLCGANRTDDASDIVFPAAPYSGTRYDLAFVECWLEEVAPLNSPEADSESVFRYGGVQSGTLQNDLQDTTAGDETTRRVQLRWQIRTVSDIDFTSFPAGVDHADRVKARGGADSDTSYTFRRSATDENLYLAGDGTLTAATALNCIDGYVYALPLYKVQRRNQTAYHVQSNPYGAPPFGAVNNTPHGLFHNVIAAQDLTVLYSKVRISSDLQGRSGGAGSKIGSGNPALDEALNVIGVHQKEFEIWRKRRIQQGTATIYNKFVISGGVIGPAAGTRNLQITRTGTFTESGVSVLCMDGKIIRIKDNKTSVASIPQNSDAAAKVYYAYVYYDTAVAAYKVNVAATVPEGALKLYRIMVPAGDMAADLNACAFADERRVEANYSNFYRSTPFVLIGIPGHTMLGGAYEVQMTVESASGDIVQAGDLVAYDKARNGFKVKLTGSADNVLFRWTLIDSQN